MILHTQPRGRWNDLDFDCIEAYQQIEAERCRQCGQYRWICQNEDQDIDFDVMEVTCFAMRRVKEFEEGSKKTDKQRWGVTLQPVARTTSGAEIGAETRTAFYDAEYAKQQEREARQAVLLEQRAAQLAA